MPFLNDNEIQELGFKHVGKNVRISTRAAIYDAAQIEIGDNSRIDDFCIISGRVSIGRNVHIAVFCNVAGGSEGIIFDDFSGLAYGCQVFTQSDDYSGKSLTNPTAPDGYKKETKKAIKIGRHAIIGTNSIIFPGVEIAEGCSIGAMTMVTKSTEPWSVYFGIPARRLKSRSKDLLLLEQQYLREEKESARGGVSEQK